MAAESFPDRSECLTLPELFWENFFKHNEKDYHEILFVYLINNKDINGKELIEVIDKDEAINKWYSIDELKNLDVRPKEIISNINTNQIIHDIILDWKRF